MVLCCYIAGGRGSPLLGDVGKHILPWIYPIGRSVHHQRIRFEIRTHKRHQLVGCICPHKQENDYGMVRTGYSFECIGRCLAASRVTRSTSIGVG